MRFIPNGISLREALRLAHELGLTVRQPPGTGEWLIADSARSAVRHDARRKVASRALVVLLRRATQRSNAA